MDPKVTGLLILIFVLGASIGGGAVYWWSGEYYNPQIESLKIQYQLLDDQKESLDQQYLSLSVSFQNILHEKNDLDVMYNTLTEEFSSLENNYMQLSNDIRKLGSDYNESLDYLTDLSSNIASFQNTLDSYSVFIKSFQRTLTEVEMNKVNATTSSITNYSLDEWYNLGRIYDWLNNNIVKIQDNYFPQIVSIDTFLYKDREIVNEFEMGFIENYIQTPEFTVLKKQGDGEDHILAEYAMNYVYMKYTLKKMYQMYVGIISLENGNQHPIIMLKAGTNLVSIFDPIGGFRTTKNGNMAYENVDFEFTAYESYYNVKKTPLKEVTLYEINPEDGTSIIVAKGSLLDLKNVFN
ncbi:hypothetical protein JW865_06095 [Candidatus Bathyarchaeota archaeon]|nr:hypothetical protein [Candidatus Bathyarchaeota archaeon]